MCPYCLADQPFYFSEGVCRRCLAYRTELIQEWQPVIAEFDHDLPFAMTQEQVWASEELVKLSSDKHLCVEAVCGAGKTEMCVPLIKDCLEKGKTVGWATPRRQIVIELGQRLSRYFPSHRVVSVYGSNTQELVGDVVVLTTHQLFRYHRFFDVLIVDEPDAFPFKGDDLLADFMRASLRGNLVFLSATFDFEQFPELEIHTIHVNRRPSNEPLVVPRLTYNRLVAFVELLHLRNEKVLLFVPTIKLAHLLARILRCEELTSKTEKAEEVLERFRRKKSGLLVTTTVLERGVTFLDCFVIVYDAGHAVFDEASLVQIAGRVRRGMNPSKGDCLFYVKERSEVVEACLSRIKKANAAGYAFDV